MVELTVGEPIHEATSAHSLVFGPTNLNGIPRVIHECIGCNLAGPEHPGIRILVTERCGTHDS